MPNLIDLTGKIFGNIRCDSQAESKSGKTYWNCSCIICGKQKIIQGTHLRNGNTTSCGCHPYKIRPQNTKQKINEDIPIILICSLCGKEFIKDKSNGKRKYCYECSPRITAECPQGKCAMIKRNHIKQALVNYKGGKCEICGYNKSLRALSFHHIDSNEKDFSISQNITKDLDELKAEVDKCLLVCANCHMEIHEKIEKDSFNLDI